jgi:hypothetical protein
MPCEQCGAESAKKTVIGTHDARYELQLCEKCRADIRKQWRYKADYVTKHFSVHWKHRKVEITNGPPRSVPQGDPGAAVVRMRDAGATYANIAKTLKISVSRTHGLYQKHKHKDAPR